MGLISALGSIAVGCLFVWDGKGVTGAKAYDPVKHILTAVSIPYDAAMQVWGVLFVVLGLVALWPIVTPRNLIVRGQALVPVALLWVVFSVSFLSFAVGHSGTGAVGSVIWMMIAVYTLTAAFVFFQHAREQ